MPKMSKVYRNASHNILLFLTCCHEACHNSLPHIRFHMLWGGLWTSKTSHQSLESEYVQMVDGTVVGRYSCHYTVLCARISS